MNKLPIRLLDCAFQQATDAWLRLIRGPPAVIVRDSLRVGTVSGRVDRPRLIPIITSGGGVLRWEVFVLRS